MYFSLIAELSSLNCVFVLRHRILIDSLFMVLLQKQHLCLKIWVYWLRLPLLFLLLFDS